MASGGTSKSHSTVDFPECLTDTFSSEVMTSDIAGNFPGVRIIKDTVSRNLHVFGPDTATVENAVFVLRNFISEASIQKIYAEACMDGAETENRANEKVNHPSPVPRSGSASSSDDNNNSNNSNEPIGLEIRLKEFAPDITEEEIRSLFQWMVAQEIVCPMDMDKDGDFLSGTVYVKFKNRRDCSTARENLTAFYPNYESSTISRGSWDSIVGSKKRETKKSVFNVSDPEVLDRYLRHHESDDGGDAEQFRRNAAVRRDLLQQKGDKQPPQPPRPRSSDAHSSSSRRPISPPQPPNNAKRPFAYQDDSNRVPGNNYNKTSSSNNKAIAVRSPYYQQQVPAIPPVPSRSPRLRTVSIDANNLCMHHGNHQFYSCIGLETAVNYFLQRGHREVFAFVPEMKIRGSPQNQNPRIERQDILHKLEGEGHLTVVPRKKLADGSKVNPYDDVLIVKYAYETKGVIISNDNMIDVGRQYPQYSDYIDKWRITFCFAGDHFLLTPDPNGRSGLGAEEMLIADR